MNMGEPVKVDRGGNHLKKYYRFSVSQNKEVLDWMKIPRCDKFVDWVVQSSIILGGQPCPNCFRWCEKSGGCNHYKCKCLHDFCWLCLGKIKSSGKTSGLDKVDK